MNEGEIPLPRANQFAARRDANQFKLTTIGTANVNDIVDSMVDFIPEGPLALFHNDSSPEQAVKIVQSIIARDKVSTLSDTQQRAVRFATGDNFHMALWIVAGGVDAGVAFTIPPTASMMGAIIGAGSWVHDGIHPEVEKLLQALTAMAPSAKDEALLRASRSASFGNADTAFITKMAGLLNDKSLQEDTKAFVDVSLSGAPLWATTAALRDLCSAATDLGCASVVHDALVGVSLLLDASSVEGNQFVGEEWLVRRRHEKLREEVCEELKRLSLADAKSFTRMSARAAAAVFARTVMTTRFDAPTGKGGPKGKGKGPKGGRKGNYKGKGKLQPFAIADGQKGTAKGGKGANKGGLAHAIEDAPAAPYP